MIKKLQCLFKGRHDWITLMRREDPATGAVKITPVLPPLTILMSNMGYEKIGNVCARCKREDLYVHRN